MARRGDLIRCTRSGEDLDTGKVSFLFTLNGRKIALEDGEVEIFTLKNSNGPLYPYVGMADGCSVLARVRITLNHANVITLTKNNSTLFFRRKTTTI